MVTVIDAANFLTQYQGSGTLSDRELALSESDERTIADLFADPVEFADVLVVNKVDLVTSAQREELRAILHRLNPGAFIVESRRGRP